MAENPRDFIQTQGFFTWQGVLTALLAVSLVLSIPAQNDQAGAAGEGQFTIGSASGFAGSLIDLNINFTAGSPSVSGFQFDLSLPTGITYVSVTAGPAATAAGKSVQANMTGGILRTLIFGFNTTAIGNGVVAIIRLQLGATVASGTYTLPATGVVATDADGQQVALLSQNGSVTVIGAGDTTPPVISVVGVSAVTQTGVLITWITDEPANSQVEYGTTTSYGQSTIADSEMVISHNVSISELSSGTLYHYRVKSRDAAGNLAQSGDYTFTTQVASDTESPTVSITTPSMGAFVSGVSVTISASASDNVGVAGVQFQLDGNDLGSEDTLSPFSYSWNTTQVSNGYHTIGAVARDAAGNYTSASAVIVTVNNVVSDTIPPSVPVGLTATAVSSSQINLAWSVSTDNVGVTGYRIYRGGTQIATSTTNSYQNTGLTAGTTYSYTVAAYDAASNVSAQSAPVSATTMGIGDTTPPVISSVVVSQVSVNSNQINWITNEASDSQVEYGLTTSFGQTSALNTNLVTTHSVTLTNLVERSVYYYRVKSRDAAGNLAVSAVGTFTTKYSSTPPLRPL